MAHVRSDDGKSMLGQWARLTWSLRMSSHAALALHAARTRRKPTWLLVGVASLAGDMLLTVALRRSSGGARWRLALDAVDAAFWSAAVGPDAGTARAAQVAAMVPPALLAGYRFGAGDEAVPIVEPAQPFPPGRGWRPWVRPTIELLAPTIVPATTAAVARRQRGYDTQVAQAGWGVLATAMGFGTARLRHRLQAQARIDWDARARRHVEIERRAMHVHAATNASPGHDFKKVLVALGYFGSDAARFSALEQMDHPRQVLAGSGGTTLRHVATDVRIEPPSAWTTWLSAAHADEVRQFIESTERSPMGDGDALVVAASPRSTWLTYRGRALVLENQPPRLQAVLDPIPAGLALAAVWKILLVKDSLGRVAPVPALLGAGLDLASLAVHHATRRPDMQPTPAVLALVTASAAVVDLTIATGRARTRTREGVDLYPGTMATGSLFVVSARYWEAMGRFRFVAVAGGVALWLAAAVLPERRTVASLMQEAAFPAAMALAIVGVGDRIAAEARSLEASLRGEFSRRITDARSDAVAMELARYRDQLELATRELDRLRVQLPADIVAAVEAECDSVRAWLEDPRTPTSLVS